MADNSTAKFSPQSHFFTDPAAITQSAAQAFGPVSDQIFKLTSNFTVTGMPKVFAICTGNVLVQTQTGNASAVNVILRPYKQPIQGFNIKYFIYRGLNKSDFFDSSINVIAASATTSDLVNKMNAAFAAFNTTADPGGALPVFQAKFIGFDPANQPDTMMLSDLFFNKTVYTTTNSQTTENSATAFELPMAAIGSSLGTFINGECGVDIVLNYGDYQLPAPNNEFVFNLAYARAAQSSLDITAISDDFQQKLVREQLFQFLEVAAYFGFHADNGTVIVDSAGTKVNKTGQEIYNDVIQNFNTKNNLYLYIQSDRTRSYNFYSNYNISDTDDNSMMMGYTADTLTERGYDTNDWPIIIDNAAQNRTDTRNQLYLQFVTDNNVNLMLYGQVAQIENAQGNNFCDADNLQLPLNADGTAPLLTKIINLSNPSTGPANAKLNIASFNLLIYQGQTYDYVAGQTTDSNGTTTDVLAEPNFFDDVFDLLNATPLLKAGSDTAYSTVSSQRIKLINHYYNDTQYGISAVQTTIVNDVLETADTITPTVNRVIFISDSVDILNDVTSVSGTVTADTKSMPSIAGATSSSDTYQLPDPFYYTITTFTDNGQGINGLQLNSTDGTIPSKIILGITQTENNLLKALIIANNLTNARLFLVELFDNGNQLVSNEDVIYQKFKAGIVGESSTGELQLKLSATDINIYSIDRKYHFSKAFSDYVKLTNTVISMVLDLNISL